MTDEAATDLDQREEVLQAGIDGLQQRLADAVAATRQSEWDLYQGVSDSLSLLMVMGVAEYVSGAAAYVGSLVGFSTAWSLQARRMAQEFPVEYRYLDVDVAIYRKALAYPDPLEALQYAIAHGLSAKELQAWIDQELGKEQATPRTVVEVEAVMDWSDGADIRLTPVPGGIAPTLQLQQGLSGIPVRARLASFEFRKEQPPLPLDAENPPAPLDNGDAI